MRELMKRLTAPCFNQHNEEDIREECMMDKRHYDFSRHMMNVDKNG